MVHREHWGCGALILLICALSAGGAQEPAATPLTVSLTVKHNGKVRKPPGPITLTFDNRSIPVRLYRGRFTVPRKALQNGEVTVSLRIRRETVRFYVRPFMLKESTWTLFMADQGYRNNDIDFIVPKDADIRSSCILMVESEFTEGRLQFTPHCRSR